MSTYLLYIHRVKPSPTKLPGSKMIPALQSVLSMLALKLTGKERLSHIMDVCTDKGFALFAGMNILPKIGRK